MTPPSLFYPERNFLFLMMLLYSLLSCTKHDNNPYSTATTCLDDGWVFFYDNQMFNATVPGCIHTNLYDNNIIPDPFFGNNESSIQWIHDSVWIYKKTFTLNSLPKSHFKNLVFEGLDTYTKIYLNDTLLNTEYSPFSTFNMFRKWSFNISDIIQDTNTIIIKFFPSSQINEEKAKNLPYGLPDNRVFTRKAPYHYGWDWGPTFITCGIWKHVYIESWNGILPSDFQIYTKHLNANSAEIELIADVLSTSSRSVNISVFVNNVKTTSTKKHIVNGNNSIHISNIINNPKLWYPSNMGDQYRYNIKMTFGGTIVLEKNIGLREIIFLTDKDSIGSKFEFVVNGKPTFMKGANYIPSESFPSNNSYEKTLQLLTNCKEANFNMLRVWGGGIYENDYFYDICDSLGILIWQDFIFACALYPADTCFLNNCKAEIIEQVLRLRNHPCICLWCGNNEIKNGWEDWGWQNMYNSIEKKSIAHNYDTLFNSIIPDIINKYDNQTAYHPSSPSYGWGHKECVSDGDSHYWGIWWGEEPFEQWQKKTGRFMSEYGFQAFPSPFTIQKFTHPSQRNLYSPEFKNHQKHPKGFKIIDDYMKMYFNVPNDFDNYAYLTQLLQAYGVSNAIETHRIRMPHCMGTLFWQLNDCWPCISWSCIDYYNNKKALFFMAKRKFEQLIVASELHNDSLSVFLVSDYDSIINGILSIKIMDFNGNVLKENSFTTTANKNTSSLVYDNIIKKEFLKQKNKVFVYLSFTYNNKIASKVQYIAYPKLLKLEEPNIKIRLVNKENKTYYYSIVSDKLAKDVYCYSETKGNFSDNYFDLLPNIEKSITFTAENFCDSISFKIKTYKNAF